MLKSLCAGMVVITDTGDSLVMGLTIVDGDDIAAETAFEAADGAEAEGESGLATMFAVLSGCLIPVATSTSFGCKTCAPTVHVSVRRLSIW